MERVVTPHSEKLPEGGYLATSDDVQGSSRKTGPYKKSSKSFATSRRR